MFQIAMQILPNMTQRATVRDGIHLTPVASAQKEHTNAEKIDIALWPVGKVLIWLCE